MKNNNAEYQGTVLENETNLPIEDAYVAMWINHNGSNGVYSATRTNKNGNFSLKYHKRNDSHYSIGVSSNKSYTYFSEKVEDQRRKITVYLNPFAYLKIRAKNSFGTGNNLSYNINYNQGGGNKFVNAYKDTTFAEVCKVGTGSGIYITWHYQTPSWQIDRDSLITINKKTIQQLF